MHYTKQYCSQAAPVVVCPLTNSRRHSYSFNRVCKLKRGTSQGQLTSVLHCSACRLLMGLMLDTSLVIKQHRQSSAQ
jgi:mRNA-degrading endonuclease toxin of MazEF toxin-antitoxin module